MNSNMSGKDIPQGTTATTALSSSPPDLPPFYYCVHCWRTDFRSVRGVHQHQIRFCPIIKRKDIVERMIEARMKEAAEGCELRPSANVKDEENDCCWEWVEDCFGHEVLHYTGG